MCTHRILPQKNVLIRVCPPNCTAGPQWCSVTMRNTTSWCLGTIKSMSRRFSPSPELMLNFSIVPEIGKSAFDRFFCTQTPTDGIASSCITKYSTACEIWELNSQYFVFFMQTRVWAKYIPKWDVFGVNTVLGEKYEILGVQRPYCAGNRV